MLTLNLFINIMQRVNMKVWLVLATTWIWWAAIIGPVAWVCSSSLSVTGGGHNNALSIDTVEFYATGCTKDSYSTFLKSLRTRLSSGDSVYNIRCCLLNPVPNRICFW
ncbi:uncharacterized protein M6B38_270745 [Iris pallida]|uniref:Uncharacterized protein n=1 Tax=Iris pallida TaxID=29817 RepID=A0AAX6I8B4_IRIPA|nr:uncharacterized protein M6B38_270745 [Iris pallida]